MNLHNAELLQGNSPEAIIEQLSRIPRQQYDKKVKQALDSNDNDYSDHGYGQITYKNRIYIPPTHHPRPNQTLQNKIIRRHHDTIAAGHPGSYKTQELITRNYWWPHMQSDIKEYIKTCEACQRTKVHRDKPHNPLNPNEIPSRPWEHISADLIGPLPLASDQYDGILVIVD